MKKIRGYILYDGILRKFNSKGEKSGWTYLEIPATTAGQLIPGNKKTFRIKGLFDDVPVKQVALLPMGDGNFIIPINGPMRKALGKRAGDPISIRIQVDKSEFETDEDFAACLEDDKLAKARFMELAPSHRKYFSKWIAEAKTTPTKTKRIALALEALAQKMDFGQMLRLQKGRQ